ncbi:MAG: Rrf2 family transcriptional regulator [Bacillota bacterium]|nr:Rrf2 family transcriptional regulator [Bacillota bacterium]
MITKKAEYAIIILTELASRPAGTTITSKEIAANRSIPVNLVVQLLALLKEAGWTVGTRGPSGGIRLNSDPRYITLKEVIEKIDGPIGITRCLFSETPCRDQTHCSLRGIWSKAQQAMLSVLEDVTIQDLTEMAAVEC